MTEQQTEYGDTVVAKRQPINIDFSQGIVPQTYSEAMQMAALLHKSGLAPAALNTVEKVAIAMMMCVELGRPIMTGIMDISVINGKAGIYGDAALGLIRASGKLEYIKETESGTPYTDGWTFRCEVKRKGSPQPRVGVWGWQDAKRAGVDNPTRRDGTPDNFSPWRRFTRRMMQFKARNFPIRDEFGDVLKGMRLAEDNYDTIDMYTTPNGSWESEQAMETQKDAWAEVPQDTGNQPEPEVESAKNTADEKSVETAFEEWADTLGIGSAVLEFVNATAKANELTAREVMAKALENEQQFVDALMKWWRKRQEDEKPEKEEAKEDSTTPADADEALRQEFINLRQAGYSTWIWKNKNRLMEAPKTIQQQAKDKWQKFYPEEQFPLDPEPATEPPLPTPPEEEEKEGQTDWENDFDLANRWRTCLEKNRKLSLDLLKEQTGYDYFRAVPKESRLDVLAAIEGEVLA